MISSVVKTMVRKDLDLNRRFIPGVVAAGLLSIAATAFNDIGFIIGTVLYITTIVAFGLLLGMYGIAQEREKKIHHFILSLPVTPVDYVVSKIISSLLCFALPWAFLTVLITVLIVSLDSVSNGTITFMLVMQFYFLCNFCIFLSVVLLTSAEKWVVTAIIVTNMSITIAINLFSRVPSIARNMDADTVVWSADVLAILVMEIAICVLVLLTAVVIQKRRKDQI